MTSGGSEAGRAEEAQRNGARKWRSDSLERNPEQEGVRAGSAISVPESGAQTWGDVREGAGSGPKDLGRRGQEDSLSPLEWGAPFGSFRPTYTYKEATVIPEFRRGAEVHSRGGSIL